MKNCRFPYSKPGQLDSQPTILSEAVYLGGLQHDLDSAAQPLIAFKCLCDACKLLAAADPVADAPPFFISGEGLGGHYRISATSYFRSSLFSSPGSTFIIV